LSQGIWGTGGSPPGFTPPLRLFGSSIGFCAILARTPELLGRDEIDDKNLVGLCGVVKVSHTVVNGTSLPNLDAFAPRDHWAELSTETNRPNNATQVAS